MKKVTLKSENEMTEHDDIDADYDLEESIKALLEELDDIFGPEEPIDEETEKFIEIWLSEGDEDE